MSSAACTSGRYGADCLLVCSGNCINGSTCDRETGQCPMPESGPRCEAGFFGESCEWGTHYILDEITVFILSVAYVLDRYSAFPANWMGCIKCSIVHQSQGARWNSLGFLLVVQYQTCIHFITKITWLKSGFYCACIPETKLEKRIHSWPLHCFPPFEVTVLLLYWQSLSYRLEVFVGENVLDS